MNKRKNIFISSISRFAKILSGILLVALLSLFFNALFASCTSNTGDEPPYSTTQINSKAPITSTPVGQLRSMADWETYKKELYDFTIKYPPQLIVSEETQENIEGKQFARLHSAKFYSLEAAPEAIMPEETEERQQFEEQYIFVYLQIHEALPNLRLIEAIQQIYSKPSVNPQKTEFELIEPYLMPYNNGSDDALIFVGNAGENSQKMIFFSHNGRVYTITLYGSGGTGGTYSVTAENVFDLMVSSIELQS